MEDVGYEGYVDFEYEGSKYTPFDAARTGIPYLHELYGSIHRKKGAFLYAYRETVPYLFHCAD